MDDLASALPDGRDAVPVLLTVLVPVKRAETLVDYLASAVESARDGEIARAIETLQSAAHLHRRDYPETECWLTPYPGAESVEVG